MARIPGISPIHLARLRIGCSSLNYHLSENLHVINNAACQCGFYREDPDHYFLSCPIYYAQRRNLFDDLGEIQITSAHDLIHGIDRCDLEKNIRIIDAALKFVNDSKRF